MRDILPHLELWQREAEEIALATLVGVRGSAPRPAGARLVVTRSGRMAGSVSGGCVESDIFERAQQVLEQGRPMLVQYAGVDAEDLAVGLACGGSIEVLIEAFEADAAWRALAAARQRGRPIAACVALDPEPLRGRRLAVGGSGAADGSIDRELDPELTAAARRLLAARGAAAQTLELAWRGGTARVFVEAFAPPPRLFVVGATHIAIPLCRMATELGLRVHVIDPRPIFASDERFPEADALIRAWPDEAFEKLELDADSHVVTLTHDPKFDLPALASALRSEAGYVGALGSRATHQRRRSRLREQGFGDAELARIRTPVGLDLGARTPEEIALSILSEIVAVRRGRDGGPLVERRAPIHDER
jgi:xanthine dehydrogenase accessory factor